MSSEYFWFGVLGIAAVITSIVSLLFLLSVSYKAMAELKNSDPLDLPNWTNFFLNEENFSILICYREEWNQELENLSANRIQNIIFRRTLKYLLDGALSTLRRDLLPSRLFASLKDSFRLVRTTIVSALPIYPQLLFLMLPNFIFSLWSTHTQAPLVYYGSVLFLILVAPCIDGAVSAYVYQSMDTSPSTPRSVMHSLRWGIARMPQYLLVILLLFICASLPVALSFLGFTLGPLAFLISLMFVLPLLGLLMILITISPVALVVENLSAAESLRRCLGLVRGQFWFASIALIVGVLVFETLIDYQIDRSLLRAGTQDGASSVKSLLTFFFSPLSSVFAIVLFRSLLPPPQRQRSAT